MKRLNVTNGYVCCPVENRQGLLLELLNRHYDQQDKAWNKKIVIVFSHDNCVRFYTELFQRLKQLPIIPLLKANLKSQGGLDDYSLFLEAETAVIAVSTRTALQLPGLTADKIIQYEPPLSLQSVSSLSSMCSDYLLFLRPQEVSFVEELRRSGGALSSMSEQFVPWDSVRKLPKQKVQQWYKNIHSMNINSKAAYKAYMDSIRDHQLSDIFNLEGVLIKEVALITPMLPPCM
uniref:ATP-dependent RNA helicase has1-like n=1 Tax=Hirondellea gigas TaxID=1518452 RepID=A0A6A7FUL6_9CRUS